MVSRKAKIFFTLFLICCKAYSFAACTLPDSSDEETSAIHPFVRAYYSQYLGFEIDKIENPKMYATIEDWLNTPYKYGGRSKQGIDCSDFASVLYDSTFRITFSGGSADVYKKVNPISKSELKEGDLVFFKIRNNRISHVGVYLTKNKFVHATVQAGVIISDLDEPYYLKHYFGSGRLID
jgi:murein DD-endopeptidase / murein LD-carboxypeptidase